MNKMKKQYSEIIRYLIVGVLTTVVSLGSYWICVEFFLNPESAIQLQIANIISWICAVTFAYITNRVFVFGGSNQGIWKEIKLFVAARIGSLLMDMAMMFIGVTLLGINDKLVKLAVQVVVTVLNYVLSKWIVFRKK